MMPPHWPRRLARTLLLPAVAVGLVACGPALGQTGTTPVPEGTTPVAPTPPPVEPAPVNCTSSVTVNLLEARAHCLVRHGLVWTTGDEANVGGLDFVPTGTDARLTFDPLNVRVAARGYKVLMKGSLFGVNLPPIVLHRAGPIDMSFQGEPTVVNLVGGLMQPTGRSTNLNHVATLPGLAGVDALPLVAGTGYVDYSHVTHAHVDELAHRIPSLHSQDVVFTKADIGVAEMEPITFSITPSAEDTATDTTCATRVADRPVTPAPAPEHATDPMSPLVPTARRASNQAASQAGSLFGLAVGGDVTIAPAKRDNVIGLDVTLHVQLPGVLCGVSGGTRIFAGADGSLRADRLEIDAGRIVIPPLRLQPLRLTYDAAERLWDSHLGVFIDPQVGGLATTGIDGEVRIQDGALQRIGVTVVGLPIPLGATGIKIYKLGGTLHLAPLGLQARAGLGFGPPPPGSSDPLVNVDGTLDFDRQRIGVGGDFSIGSMTLGNATAHYSWDGVATLTGTIDHTFAPGVLLHARVAGHVARVGVQVEGAADFRTPGIRLTGNALVSSVGIAGCGVLGGPSWFGSLRLGVGYRWGDPEMTWLGAACDMSPYRVFQSTAKGEQGLAAGAVRTVDVARADRAIAIRVEGSEAPPVVTLRDPRGGVITTPDGTSGLTRPRYVVARNTGDNSTTVLVGRPAAGRWTVTPAAGSDITTLEVSRSLPPNPVTASLRGGRLRYAITRAPQQLVRFSEEGTDVSRIIATRTRGAGSMAFTPARGPGGTRRIVAEVIENGLVRREFTVARFRAAPSVLAAPVVSVTRVSAHDGGARVAWQPVPGATGYEVVASYNGRTQVYEVGARRRMVSIGDVMPSSGVIAHVRAVSTYPIEGPNGTATLAPALR